MCRESQKNLSFGSLSVLPTLQFLFLYYSIWPSIRENTLFLTTQKLQCFLIVQADFQWMLRLLHLYFNLLKSFTSFHVAGITGFIKNIYNNSRMACVFEMSFSLVPNKRCFWAVCNLLSVKQL